MIIFKKIKEVCYKDLGIFYMIVASILFAITGAFSKVLSQNLSSIEVVFFRNFIGLLFILPIIIKVKFNQKGGKIWLLIFRAFIGTMALLAFFYNIAHISLGAAFTFSKTSTIFTAVLATILLNERLSLQSWFFIFLGFFGIICIVQPNLGLSKSDFLGIFSGFGAALAYTSIKKLNGFYDARVIVAVFLLFGSFIPAFFMGISEFVEISELDFLLAKFVMPNFKEWIYILLMGGFGVLFQIYMTKAYASSKKVGIVAAVGYCDVIFSLIIGIFLGDDLPNLIAGVGIFLIILSGIFVTLDKK